MTVSVSRRAGIISAQIAGESSAMDGAALAVKGAARTVAMRHRKTGNYINQLMIVSVPGERGTGRTVRDRLVVADDPGAAAIEWGHLIRHEGSRRVTWVPGQHIMTTAKGMVS